jgi:uncharacterized membrane protein
MAVVDGVLRELDSNSISQKLDHLRSDLRDTNRAVENLTTAIAAIEHTDRRRFDRS